jgi:dipeptidyl-peptidase-3
MRSCTLIISAGILRSFTVLPPDRKILIQIRAAWNGTNIILQQVSPESPVIFRLIIALHNLCRGEWHELLRWKAFQRIPRTESERDLREFLNYAATFLSNIGNYYVSVHL